jgi:hypothetical protein
MLGTVMYIENFIILAVVCSAEAGNKKFVKYRQEGSFLYMDIGILP